VAFREVGVHEIREVLRLWLRGEGFRSVARLARVDRKTVRRYVEAARACGLDQAGGEGQLGDELLSRVAERVRPHRADGHGQSWALLAAHHAQFKELLDEGLTVVKAGELLAREGVVVPERTLHRYALEVLGHGRGRRATVRVADGEPGAECQVDFGKMGLLYDSQAGRRRVVHALIFTAVYSRHMFVWLSFRQDLAAVIAGFEAAWAFFGGVFKVVIPDNMAAIVDRAHPLEPRLNRAFAEYAQARGFLVDPARVRRPADKPRVAYCTSWERLVARWRSCRSQGVVPASLVGGWRVGAGRVVEDFAFVVIPLPADNSGVVPDLDGAGGHAEQLGHLGERDQAVVQQALAAAG
jgi:transposase